MAEDITANKTENFEELLNIPIGITIDKDKLNNNLIFIKSQINTVFETIKESANITIRDSEILTNRTVQRIVDTINQQKINLAIKLKHSKLEFVDVKEQTKVFDNLTTDYLKYITSVQEEKLSPFTETIIDSDKLLTTLDTLYGSLDKLNTKTKAMTDLSNTIKQLYSHIQKQIEITPNINLENIIPQVNKLYEIYTEVSINKIGAVEQQLKKLEKREKIKKGIEVTTAIPVVSGLFTMMGGAFGNLLVRKMFPLLGIDKLLKWTWGKIFGKPKEKELLQQQIADEVKVRKVLNQTLIDVVSGLETIVFPEKTREFYEKRKEELIPSPLEIESKAKTEEIRTSVIDDIDEIYYKIHHIISKPIEIEPKVDVKPTKPIEIEPEINIKSMKPVEIEPKVDVKPTKPVEIEPEINIKSMKPVEIEPKVDVKSIPKTEIGIKKIIEEKIPTNKFVFAEKETPNILNEILSEIKSTCQQFKNIAREILEQKTEISAKKPSKEEPMIVPSEKFTFVGKDISIKHIISQISSLKSSLKSSFMGSLQKVIPKPLNMLIKGITNSIKVLKMISFTGLATLLPILGIASGIALLVFTFVKHRKDLGDIFSGKSFKERAYATEQMTITHEKAIEIEKKLNKQLSEDRLKLAEATNRKEIESIEKRISIATEQKKQAQKMAKESNMSQAKMVKDMCSDVVSTHFNISKDIVKYGTPIDLLSKGVKSFFGKFGKKESMDIGGTVDTTGTVVVHKGEEVIPAEITKEDGVVLNQLKQLNKNKNISSTISPIIEPKIEVKTDLSQLNSNFGLLTSALGSLPKEDSVISLMIELKDLLSKIKTGLDLLNTSDEKKEKKSLFGLAIPELKT